MPSQTDLFNRALSRLGVRRISSPAEDSPGAKACSSAWDMVRQEVLRAHPWNIAVRRSTLAAAVDAPEYEYERAFTLPALCLRVLEVDVDPSYPWTVEGDQILTDATAPLYIRWIEDVTDPERYDALLSSVLVARLALEIASEVTSSSAAQQQSLMAIYLRLLGQARAVDAMESSPVELEDTSWITVRY
jgi:hypothetical protein